VIRFFFHQRVTFWHQHAPAKAIAGKAHKRRCFLARRGSESKVSPTGRHKLYNLIRIALANAEMNVWEAMPKKLHHGHQDISRVNMRCRYG
jgi:hypothetical protein